MNRSTLSTERGFTLIELLVVIAIIGILAAIALPQFSAYRRRGFDTDVRSNIKSALTAEEAYFTDKLTYSSSLGNLASWGFKQSAQVNITPSGTVTTFIISGGATAGCSPATGIWSFNSVTGITTGVACN